MCCVFYLRFFNYMLCCMCCVRLSCWIKITYLLTYQSLAVYLLMALPVGCGHHWTTVAVWTVTRHRTALTRFHDSLTSEISYDFCQIIWKQSSYWEEINGLNCILLWHPLHDGLHDSMYNLLLRNKSTTSERAEGEVTEQDAYCSQVLNRAGFSWWEAWA